jgi:2,3-bisphosphoglycerate-dependent phosphoglycerate mutase
MVYDRVVSYYQLEIEPLLKSGHNILIVAHGNSLRALVKYLRNLTNEEVAQLEIATGEVLFFEFN